MTDEQIRTCRGPCGLELSIDNFSLETNRNKTKAHRWICKKCVNQRRRTKKANRTDERRQLDLERNRGYWKENSHKYKRTLPEKTSLRWKLSKIRVLGLQHQTDDILQAFETQETCTICNQVNIADRQLSIDHCHIKNKFRGLLCSLCNVTLGHAKDSPHILRMAAKYLEKKR